MLADLCPGLDFISFTFWAPSKSRRDGLFIDRQLPYLRFLFVFQRRGSVASDVSGRVLRAAEKQKETSWAVLVYKQAIPTGFQDLDTRSASIGFATLVYQISRMPPPKMWVMTSVLCRFGLKPFGMTGSSSHTLSRRYR